MQRKYNVLHYVNLRRIYFRSSTSQQPEIQFMLLAYLATLWWQDGHLAYKSSAYKGFH